MEADSTRTLSYCRTNGTKVALEAASRLRVVSDLVPISKATTLKATRLKIYCMLLQ